VRRPIAPDQRDPDKLFTPPAKTRRSHAKNLQPRFRACKTGCDCAGLQGSGRRNSFAGSGMTPRARTGRLLLPLDGITVVALEHAIAAPFCTRQLADLGARVIKIERPGVGDFARAYDERVRGMASHFVWCNRSKESFTLDVKHRAAAEVLSKLLENADVLVQNLAPGASARLGLSYEALRKLHPQLIVCDISGYGGDGPYRDKKAYDLLIQSESGFLSITGSPEQPSKAGNSISDIAAGMYAYSSILAALLQRARGGEGCRIDVSMLESMVEWMSYALYYAFDGAGPPPRTGAAHATICPYGPFPAGDGKTVMLGLQNEREWVDFCERVLEMPGLSVDARFSSNSLRTARRRELSDIIANIFSKLTAQQVIERLENAHIANARINEISDVWSHVQLRERGRWVEIDTPAGKIPALIPPGIPDGFAAQMGSVPALGEHTDAILTELGYSEAAIRELRMERAI
jgi:itaconate CoA-transferase